ncbi:MAG: fluoride efflux transporter CrcB [Acidobacteriota bacterium]|nr:fluoride efflux transporter CrcB [Acidobacteriota bacterium]
MSAWAWIGVAVAGGLGAVARFLLDGWVDLGAGRELPLGTFAINVSGAFALGLVDGLALSGDAMLIAGTAAIGAYTTFSTWMFETHRLAEDGEFTAAALNVGISIVVGFGAVVLGHLLGRQL